VNTLYCPNNNNNNNNLMNDEKMLLLCSIATKLSKQTLHNRYMIDRHPSTTKKDLVGQQRTRNMKFFIALN
jgi:hypothetical protein